MSNYDIIVVGAGVFGLSAAVQLRKCGYSVVVIDKLSIPSSLSASYDYNKIVRLEYNDPIYAELAVEAMKYWQGDFSELLPQGMLHDSYSHCGRISILQDNNSDRFKFEESSLNLLQEKFGRCKNATIFDNLSCNGMFKQFEHGANVGLVRWNPDCGIGMATESLILMKNYARSLGVIFHELDGVEIVENGFVQCESGAIFKGKQILVAAGANTAKLLSMGKQLRATGLYVGHVQLSSKEFEALKNIPVVFKGGFGYIFPPDPKTKLMKICASGMSTFHEASNGTAPVYKKFQPHIVPSIPISAIVRMRSVLAKFLPDLVFSPDGKTLRNIIDAKLCWIGDTSNSDFLIDRVPNKPNVFVACGDSGHGYKFLPNIGFYIRQRMEGTLSGALSEKWKWRDSDWINDKLDWRVQNLRIPLEDIEEWYEEQFARSRL